MTTSLVLLTGMLLAAGLVAFVVALVPSTPRLADALDRIEADGRRSSSARTDVGPLTSRSDRLGALLYRYTPIALSDRQRQQLRLQGKPIAELYSDKAVMAIIGAILPALLGFGYGQLTHTFSTLPVVLSLVGLVIGFFVPDLLLRSSSGVTRSTAVEALLIYIDLVTLERMANASATQALHNAANVSEVPLFVQIRAALERARLEQQSPYAELRRLAQQIDLPELTDVADVMQLDETGAALSGTLRARVRELRDAHLTKEQIAASASAEGMTIYMTFPALLFGVIFMAPAILKIVLG